MSVINNESNDDFLDTFPLDWQLVLGRDLFIQTSARVKDINSEYPIPVLSMTRYEGLVLQSKKFDKQVASRDIGNYKVVKNGQLVYGFPIDEGVIAIQHRFPIGAVSPAYHVWDITKDVDLTYLDIVLKTPFMIRNYSKFASNVVHRRRNLSPNDFLRVSIPLPPLPEQRAIAHVLTTIRQAIESTEQIIEATRQLKKSMMKHLFTYGPVPVDQVDWVKLKDTEIGEVPEEWQMLPLSEFCYFTTGKLDSNQSVPGGRFPFFTCSRETLQIDNYSFDQQAILLAGNNAQGIYSVKHYKGKFDAYQRTYVISITDENLLEYRYLLYELSRKLNELQNRSLGTVTKFLTGKIIRNLILTIPPFHIQKLISKQLDVIERKITYEMVRKSALESLFNSLLHHLMTGKVRVGKSD